MHKPLLYRALLTCIIPANFFLPLITRSQELAGVWEGEYKLYKKPIDIRVTLYYNETQNFYFGISQARSNSKWSNGTVIVAKKAQDSLIAAEIAVQEPKDNIPEHKIVAFKNVDITPRSTHFIFKNLRLKIEGGAKMLNGFWSNIDGENEKMFLNISASPPDKGLQKMALEAISSIVVEKLQCLPTSFGGNFKENSVAIVSYQFKNNGTYIFKNITSETYFTNDERRGLQMELNGNYNFMKGKNAQFFPAQSIAIGSQYRAGSNIPVDSAKITVTLEGTGGIPFWFYNFSLPTETFRKSSNSLAADWSSERLKLIASFYGMQAHKPNIKDQLGVRSSKDDTKAAVWEAIFMCIGQAGYVLDQATAAEYVKAGNAMLEVQEMARKGDVEAMFLTYMSFEMGIAIRLYKPEAEYFFTECLANNFDPAYYIMGIRRTIEKKKNDAWYNLDKAIKAGIVSARILSVENAEDKEKLVQEHEKLAAAGYSEASLKLYTIYLAGELLPKNRSKAIEYLKSASQVNIFAKSLLANIYLDEPNTPNLITAFKIKQEVAAMGSADACFELALIQLYSTSPKIPRNEKAAIELLKKAATAKHAQAIHLLVQLFNSKKIVPANPQEKTELFNYFSQEFAPQRLTSAPSPLIQYLLPVTGDAAAPYYDILSRYNDVVKKSKSAKGTYSLISWDDLSKIIIR